MTALVAQLLEVSFCSWLAVLALKAANYFRPRRRRSDVSWLRRL